MLKNTFQMAQEVLSGDLRSGAISWLVINHAGDFLNFFLFHFISLYVFILSNLLTIGRISKQF